MLLSERPVQQASAHRDALPGKRFDALVLHNGAESDWSMRVVGIDCNDQSVLAPVDETLFHASG